MTLPCRRTRLRCQPSTKHEDSAFVTLLRKGEQTSVDLGINLDAAEQGGRDNKRRVRDGVVAVETTKSMIEGPALCKSIKVITEDKHNGGSTQRRQHEERATGLEIAGKVEEGPRKVSEGRPHVKQRRRCRVTSMMKGHAADRRLGLPTGSSSPALVPPCSGGSQNLNSLALSSVGVAEGGAYGVGIYAL
ncbi:unnamed protein product [Clonostachys rhizophaga]|uniref:Uncharacterized protein n=1 Tax=Clonostachys rhizophaga TaxID=160324 RepID=A0A9N9VY73_9HYPO|nr:unnamed protein product [Clonostachys rhizophaga]